MTHGRHKMAMCYMCYMQAGRHSDGEEDTARHATTYRLGLNISARSGTRIQWMGSRGSRSQQGASLRESPWDAALFKVKCFPRSKYCKTRSCQRRGVEWSSRSRRWKEKCRLLGKTEWLRLTSRLQTETTGSSSQRAPLCTLSANLCHVMMSLDGAVLVHPACTL